MRIRNGTRRIIFFQNALFIKELLQCKDSFGPGALRGKFLKSLSKYELYDSRASLELSKTINFLIKHRGTHAVFQLYDSMELNYKLIPKSKQVHDLESFPATSTFLNTTNDPDPKSNVFGSTSLHTENGDQFPSCST